MKRNLVFTFLLITCTLLSAQTVMVTGTVTSSDDGTVMPGVNVTVKGLTIGAITGYDGKYSIAVPSNAQILIFSFIGMKTLELPVEGRIVIDAVMSPDLLQVDEVVVTALGISRQKKALGYSTQEVTGENISKASNPNLVNALSGKIAGMEIRQTSGMPGSPSQIYIRGARSFSGNNQPLYVVDGMPVNSGTDYGQNVLGSFSSGRSIDINPNDIESINILKGQAAAALYGLRASNGVILITTKSGKNAIAGRPSVSVTTGYSTDQLARLPEFQTLYAQGTGGNFFPVNSFSWGPLIWDLPKNATYGGDSNGHPGMFFHPQKNQWVTPKAYNSAKEFYKPGATVNTYINVSQAGSMGNYALGFGTTNQTGIVTNTGMDRYTAKMAANMNLTSKWRVGFSGNISDIKISKLPSGNDSWLFTVYGAPPSYDLIGTPYFVPSGPDNIYRQTSYRVGAVGENPLWAVRNNHFREATKRFFGNAFTEILPFEWMNIRYQFGMDMYATEQEDLLQKGSAGTGQGLPSAAQYPTPSNPNYTYVAPVGGRISDYGINRRNVNSLLNITIQKNITKDLRGILIAGNEIVQTYSRAWTITGSGFTMPGWNNLANTTKIEAAGSTIGRSKTVGFYGNLSLEYKSLVFLNATGRNDIVSSMPRGNRSFFYPSASLGFVVTELNLLKNNKILSFGKIRISYAEVGQAGSYNEPVYSLGGAGSGLLSDGINFPLGGISGFVASSQLYDPNLKPMNTRSYEIGAEIKLLNNRIGIDYSYSDQVSNDQIFAVPLASSTGFRSIVMNAGQMTSKTHEAVVYITPFKLKGFEWTVTTSFTKNVNKVIALAEGVTNISLGGFSDPNIRVFAGGTYPVIYGTSFLRDDKGRILVDENPASAFYGMPLGGGFNKIGNVSPRFLLGVNNNVTIKFITLSAQLDWKNGGQIYSGSNRLIDVYGTSKRTEDRTTPFIYPGYKENGEPNDIQRGGPSDPNAYYSLYSTLNGAISEAQVYESSFLKLREVSLSIGVPKELLKKTRISSAAISLYARNFLLWTTLPNFDPETSQGSGNMTGGMDYMSLPQTKTYGVSLNINF